MKYFILGICFALTGILLLGATNRINWLTQVLSPGNSISGQIAGVDNVGAMKYFKIGTNLSIDASGNLNAAGASPFSFTFHAAEVLTGIPNGTVTTFTVPFIPTGKVLIDVNGQNLDPSQFTQNGSSITFTVAPLASDNLHATGVSIP